MMASHIGPNGGVPVQQYDMSSTENVYAEELSVIPGTGRYFFPGKAPRRHRNP